MELIHWRYRDVLEEMGLFHWLLELLRSHANIHLICLPPICAHSWCGLRNNSNCITNCSLLCSRHEDILDILPFKKYSGASSHRHRNSKRYGTIYALCSDYYIPRRTAFHLRHTFTLTHRCHLQRFSSACIPSWLRRLLTRRLLNLTISDIYTCCVHCASGVAEYANCDNGGHFRQSEGRREQARLPGDGRTDIQVWDHFANFV